MAASEGNWDLYETAFLECAPRLEDAVKKLAAAGATEVLVLPYFLTLGIHLQRDLPKLVEELMAETGIAIRVTPPLDGHPALAKMLVDRAAEAAR
jgi:sirohydrochlorin ferrochelatase